MKVKVGARARARGQGEAHPRARAPPPAGPNPNPNPNPNLNPNPNQPTDELAHYQTRRRTLREAAPATLLALAAHPPEEAESAGGCADAATTVVRLPCSTASLPCLFNRSTVERAFAASSRCPLCSYAYCYDPLALLYPHPNPNPTLSPIPSPGTPTRSPARSRAVRCAPTAIPRAAPATR